MKSYICMVYGINQWIYLLFFIYFLEWYEVLKFIFLHFSSIRLTQQLKLLLNADNFFLTLMENFDPFGCWNVLALVFESEH